MIWTNRSVWFDLWHMYLLFTLIEIATIGPSLLSRGGGGDPYFRDLLTIVKVIGYSIGGSLLSELYSQWDKLLTTRLTLVFRPTLPSSSGSSKRYYFEHLQLNSTQLKLSVSSAGRLPEDLQSLKSSLGLILVNLEDATVDLGRCTNLDDRKIL